MARRAGKVRTVLRQLHLWLAVTVGLVLVVISVTGSVLVWRDDVDRLLAPSRYAVTGSGGAVTLPLSTYTANAISAAGAGQRAVRLTMPAEAGWPVRVELRGATADGRPTRFQSAFLDPATGKVLGMVDVSATTLGWMHNIHHMLSAPQLSGRQIVGWLGVILIGLSLSGLVLWWPRNNNLRAGLRWRRSNDVLVNLHHAVGAATALPLLVVSITGVYLCFPDTAAAFMSVFVGQHPARSHGYGALPLASPRRTIDEVATQASRAVRQSRLVSVQFPVAPRDSGHGHHAAAVATPVWRVEFRPRGDGDASSVAVDDVSGAASVLPPAHAAEVAGRWIELIHEGRRGGTAWAALAFLSGLTPPIFLVTGLAMWLRRRRRTSDAGVSNTPAGAATASAPS